MYLSAILKYVFIKFIATLNHQYCTFGRKKYVYYSRILLFFNESTKRYSPLVVTQMKTNEEPIFIFHIYIDKLIKKLN